MKPFALQTVLAYRMRLEDLAQYRLAEAKKVHQAIQQKLSAEKRALALCIDELDRLQRDGIRIGELIRYEQRITAQQHNLRAIEKNLTEKSNMVQKEQQNLLLRSKERQILEHLKERQNKAWQAYLNKKEALMLDEIATTRHDADPFSPR